MAKYFHIKSGLRGAYMPDAHHVIRCETRRELKTALESEADMHRDAGAIGLSRRAIASLAAAAWRAPSFYDRVAPFAMPHQTDRTARPFAVMVSAADRDAWKAAQNDL